MRIFLSLSPDERIALGEMARRDLRTPRDQIRYLLRQEAARRGLLPQGDAHMTETVIQPRAAAPEASGTTPEVAR